MKKLLLIAALALVASGSVFAMEKKKIKMNTFQTKENGRINLLIGEKDNTDIITEINKNDTIKNFINEKNKQITKQNKQTAKQKIQIAQQKIQIAKQKMQIDNTRLYTTKIANVTGDAAMICGGLGLGSYIKEKLDQGKTWKEIVWEARKDKKAILSATLTTIGLVSKTYSYLG